MEETNDKINFSSNINERKEERKTYFYRNFTIEEIQELLEQIIKENKEQWDKDFIQTLIYGEPLNNVNT